MWYNRHQNQKVLKHPRKANFEKPSFLRKVVKFPKIDSFLNFILKGCPFSLNTNLEANMLVSLLSRVWKQVCGSLTEPTSVENLLFLGVPPKILGQNPHKLYISWFIIIFSIILWNFSRIGAFLGMWDQKKLLKSPYLTVDGSTEIFERL